ncbi:hypothetical protein [Owenweeksia hongkongensis]|uniref:hypothetical protein n=1 Tax=Owenweeksia hongkongensis TaxID=253245 RepID=UPI003A8E87A7
MINKIIKSLEGINERAAAIEFRGDANYTKACMETLTSLAYGNNYHVYGHANIIEPTMNEWLYDMVWCTPEPQSIFHIQKIHLVVESEWKTGKDEQEYDFYKLVQARAELRLFIFQAKSVEDRMNYFKDIVERSSIAQEGDNYLLACWNDDGGFTFGSFRKGGGWDYLSN